MRTDSRRRQVLGFLGIVIAASLGMPLVAEAEPSKCRAAISKAAGAFLGAQTKALQKCEDSRVKKGTSIGGCPDARTNTKLAKAAAKLVGTSSTRSNIAKACCGEDKTCGTGDDDLPPSLGWPAQCPNFENGSCTNAIVSTEDIGICLKCISEAAVQQAIALYYGTLELSPNKPTTKEAKALGKCQATIGRAATAFLVAKSEAVQKCWKARMKGKHAASCPDINADPVTAKAARKAAEKIAQAESKNITQICKACGGADKRCDNTVPVLNPGATPPPGSGNSDDFTPTQIGFPSMCPAVEAVDPPLACGGPVVTLDHLIQCVDCVTAFKVDCTDRAAVPVFVTYPPACNLGQVIPTPTPAATPSADAEFQKLVAADSTIIPKLTELAASHSRDEALALLAQWLATQDGVSDARLVDGEAVRLTNQYGERLFHVFEWDEDHGGNEPVRQQASANVLADSAATTGKPAIILSPFSSFINSSSYQTEMVKQLSNAGFAVQGNALNTNPITLTMLDNLKNYKFIHIHTHGGYLDWNPTDGPAKEIGVATGLRSQDLTPQERAAVKADPTLTWGENGTLVFTDDYVNAHFAAGDFEGAWVGIDACQSSETSILADAFLAKGARVFFGWRDSTRPGFLADVWGTLLPQLLAGKSAQAAWEEARDGFYPTPHWTSGTFCFLDILWCTGHDTYFEMKQSPPTGDAYLGRYHDAGDGTVIDNQTWLQWEKKTGTVGPYVDCGITPCPDPHNVNNLYSWTNTADDDLTNSDGIAFTDFLVKLNTPPCFAGHCDWRLPKSGGRLDQGYPSGEPAELESILLSPFPCGASPCIAPIFGPTVANFYWSATTFAAYPWAAWYVDFDAGIVNNFSKSLYFSVRAVREVRYHDNGDDTITDNNTGLQWEKKTQELGPDYSNPHNVDNIYTWTATGSEPDGTAFTDFLVKLNTPPCFAGHCDWRLPRVSHEGDPPELETILLAPEPCDTSPCIDSIFGPTAEDFYWSATHNALSFWGVDFSDGFVGNTGGTDSVAYVRAVRTSP